MGDVPSHCWGQRRVPDLGSHACRLKGWEAWRRTLTLPTRQGTQAMVTCFLRKVAAGESGMTTGSPILAVRAWGNDVGRPEWIEGRLNIGRRLHT